MESENWWSHSLIATAFALSDSSYHSRFYWTPLSKVFYPLWLSKNAASCSTGPKFGPICCIYPYSFSLICQVFFEYLLCFRYFTKFATFRPDFRPKRIFALFEFSILLFLFVSYSLNLDNLRKQRASVPGIVTGSLNNPWNGAPIRAYLSYSSSLLWRSRKS